MISSKYLKIIVAAFLSIAIIFTVSIRLLPRNNNSFAGITKEYETKVFNKDAITRVNISMDETKWNEMLKNALKEEYYPCDITINGEIFKNVGIRPKGNTSLTQVANSDSDRYSFKIDFDYYVDGQTCFGLDKMVLNNTMSDTTYMKEYLSYDLMNYIGVKTPLYAYTDVSVNSEKWGLYLGIEGIEESFSQRNFGTDYGQLYKPESMNMGGGKEGNKFMGPPNMENGQNPFNGEMPRMKEENQDENMPTMGEKPEGVDMPPMGEKIQGEFKGGKGGPGGSGNGCDLVYTDDSINSYSNIFHSAVFKSTNSDYNRVIKALKGLSTGKNIEEYVDVDSTLRYFAANTMLVNLDSYVSSLKHNYYLYEKDGEISILPWDFNLSFAGFQSGSATSAVNFPIDTPVSGVAISERPLIGKLLENTEYKNKYHKYLQKIVDEYFNKGLFTEKVRKINNLIKDYVKNDPTAFYTYEEYEKSIPVLKEFASLRAKSVKGQLDGTISSTTSGQSSSKKDLIDASSINLNTLGTQGGGRGPNEKMDNATSDRSSQLGQNNNMDKQRPMNMKSPMEGNRKQSINKNSIVVLCSAIFALAIGTVFVIKYKRRK